MWSGNHLKVEFLKYVVFLKEMKHLKVEFLKYVVFLCGVGINLKVVFKIFGFLMWSGNQLEGSF